MIDCLGYGARLYSSPSQPRMTISQSNQSIGVAALSNHIRNIELWRLMKALRIVLLILLPVVLTSACATKQEAPTVGELRDFAAICDKANDGKRLAVEGYLRWPQSFSGTTSAVLRLYPTADASGSPIGILIHIGQKPNHLELPPKQYTDQHLKVRTSSGEIAGVETKVRISGNVYFPKVSQDMTCALDNPLVEKTK